MRNIEAHKFYINFFYLISMFSLPDKQTSTQTRIKSITMWIKWKIKYATKGQKWEKHRIWPKLPNTGICVGVRNELFEGPHQLLAVHRRLATESGIATPTIEAAIIAYGMKADSSSSHKVTSRIAKAIKHKAPLRRLIRRTKGEAFNACGPPKPVNWVPPIIRSHEWTIEMHRSFPMTLEDEIAGNFFSFSFG